MFDLAQAEWDAFASSIRGIAEQQERRDNAFESFCQWLDRWGRRHGRRLQGPRCR
jgi:hypothetical protein